MATVTLDCSEYDMLRSQNREKDETIKDLKKDIEGLKESSKVILSTKYLCKKVNKTLAERISHNIDRFYSPRDYSRWSCTPSISAIVIDAMKETPRLGDSDLQVYKETQSVVNFDDVKIKIEAELKEEYKEEIKNSIDEANRLKDNYESKLKTLDDKYLQSHIDELDALRESNLKEIHSLEAQVAELSKTKEEKIAEATKALREAQARLAELEGEKKEVKEKKVGLFQRLFK